ncbi:MAG: endonuclease/exonuclease/phosphatase family protein, partial [Pseudomonadota bacterium]
LLQEVAKPGPMTLWRDLLGAVDGASPRAERWFHADLRAWTPPPLRVVHGLATLSQLTAASATATRLPTDGRALLRLGGALGLRRRYAVLELDLPFEDGAGGGLATGWTVINLHLSAFDADARLRAAQVNALFDRAEAAHAAGRAVVLGGDWNLALTETAFPQGAAPTRCGEWLRPFPAALAPDGWSLVYDSATATVRAANQPYVEGENMRAVIDGFVVSPNVAVERCETVDLFFEASDHNPVRGRFRLCAP